MSKNTEYLKLFKYDTVQDAPDFFNIEKSLNENWDKVDANARKVSETNQELVDKSNTYLQQKGSLTSIKGSIKNLHFGIYAVDSWIGITDYPPNAYEFGTLIVLNGVIELDKVWIYFPHNTTTLAYVLKSYGNSYLGWNEMATAENMNAQHNMSVTLETNKNTSFTVASEITRRLKLGQQCGVFLTNSYKSSDLPIYKGVVTYYTDQYFTNEVFVMVHDYSERGNNSIQYNVYNRLTESFLYSWKQIATTEKIPFNVTASTNFEITEQGSYQINNVAHIRFRFRKIDRTALNTTGYFVVGRLPFIGMYCSSGSFSATDSEGNPGGYGTVMIGSNRDGIFVINRESRVTDGIVSCTYVL